jgi:hypothetical protein
MFNEIEAQYGRNHKRGLLRPINNRKDNIGEYK